MHNTFFNFLCPPEFHQKKTAEQMENFPPNPSFSICDFQIQKQISRSFGKSFPKIALPKLCPPCSATCPNTWRAEPRKKNTLSFFKRNFTPAKSEMQGVFFLSGLPRLCEAVAERFIHHSDSARNTFELCPEHTAIQQHLVAFYCILSICHTN